MSVTLATDTDGGLNVEQRRQLAEDVGRLRATYGSRWTLVPCGFGAQAVWARNVLSTGLAPVDPASCDPVRLPQELEPFANDAAAFASQLLEHVSLLDEGLSADLGALSLSRLRMVAASIQRLADSPPPNPSWADPAAADAAGVLLAALGADLRHAADLHRDLYRDFTEQVWDVCLALPLNKVERWWAVWTRHRVRSRLASVSRTGRAPVDVRHVATMLNDALQIRARIDQAWSALAGHLGAFASSPIPDVDGASAALAGLQQLQLALGEQLSSTRIRELAAADAFGCEELAVPAAAIVAAIDQWTVRARRFGCADTAACDVAEVVRWAKQVLGALAFVRSLRNSTAGLRASSRSVGQMLDDAVARDRIDVLCGVGEADASRAGVQ